MATERPRHSLGIQITPREVWDLLAEVRAEVHALKLADVDNRLKALERWKWLMLAVGTGSGGAVTTVVQQLFG